MKPTKAEISGKELERILHPDSGKSWILHCTSVSSQGEAREREFHTAVALVVGCQLRPSWGTQTVGAS